VRWLWLVVLVACGGAQTPASNREPTVVVIERGAEPRQRLRYELAPHTAQRLEIVSKARSQTTYTNTVLETGQVAADPPSVRAVCRLEVLDTDASGTAHIRFEVEDVVALDDTTDARARGLSEATAARLKGWRGSMRMSATGALGGYVVDDPNTTQAKLVDFVESAMRVPMPQLPDEPVGTGASWQVRYDPVIATVRWHSTATFTLRELSSSTATIDVSVAMRADSQPLHVEPNRSTRLTSASQSSSMQATISLTSLAVSGTEQTHGELNLSIVERRARLTKTIKTELMQTIRPLP
jgi:hypothetical protein